MEGEKLCFAEDLRQERSWERDGVTVLCASVTLPQQGTRRARRFDRYYQRFCRAYFAYCEQLLLPWARARCAAALEKSAPWTRTSCEVSYRVTLYGENTVCLFIDARETNGPVPRLVLRRADTWDLSAMLPMPMGEFFPKRASYRKRLVALARETAQTQMAQGVSVYDEAYRILLRRAFSTRNYYLTDAGLCFFYPMYAVAPSAEGIVTFTAPYDAERGPFAPSMQPEPERLSIKKEHLLG